MEGDEKYTGLLIGTNDVAHTSVTKFKASYRHLVRTAKSKGSKVLCCQIYHRGDRMDLNTKIDMFNRAIFEVAKEEECACINSTSSYNSTSQSPNIKILVGGKLHLRWWAKQTLANRLSTVIRQVDSVFSAPKSPQDAPAPHHMPHKPARREFYKGHNTQKYEHYDSYRNWDSCYHPVRTVYQQYNTTWQRYPTSAGYQPHW